MKDEFNNAIPFFHLTKNIKKMHATILSLSRIHKIIKSYKITKLVGKITKVL